MIRISYAISGQSLARLKFGANLIKAVQQKFPGRANPWQDPTTTDRFPVEAREDLGVGQFQVSTSFQCKRLVWLVISGLERDQRARRPLSQGFPVSGAVGGDAPNV
jgi:hypothetical protein